MATTVESPNFLFLRDNIPLWRILALQGGTRSAKTYSTLRYLIALCNNYSGIDVSIVRQSMPALRATAMRDFFEILENLGLYDENNHHKTENIYYLNGNMIDFFGAEEEQKLRGRKRHILFANEANELSFKSWQQLLFRTTHRVILDYNPSMIPTHWIFDKVLTRQDCKRLITTYKDNPHLTAEQIAEIELLKTTDPEAWKVYGEGIAGFIRELIYSNWDVVEAMPETGDEFYGLDFGYSNSKTALLRMKNWRDEIFEESLVYQTGMTNSDLIARMQEMAVPKHRLIYADPAEPQRIEELKRAGFNVIGADKWKKKVAIDFCRRWKIHIVRGLLSDYDKMEMQTYRWQKDRDGNISDEPVKENDHLRDAQQYGMYTHLSTPAAVPAARVTTETPRRDISDRSRASLRNS